MKNNLVATYVLANNIDCSATSGWNSGAGFEPIGKDTVPFTGIFDGKGFTISNLHINRPTTIYVGLFGVLSGEVKNVGLINNNIIGGSYTGGLVGYNEYGTISNFYSTGAVGGGGLVGGLVGFNYSGAISNSYATGAVSGTGGYVGGLVGYNYGSTISNSYSTGAVSGTGEDGWGSIGGLVGQSISSTITNSYAIGKVSGPSPVGGFVGDTETYPLFSNSYWNTQTSGQSGGCGSGTCTGASGKTTAEMVQQATYSGWDFTSIWKMAGTGYYPCLSWQNNGTCQKVVQ